MAAAFLAGMAISHGQSLVTLDGIYDPASDAYSTFEEVTFYNGHSKDSTYGPFADQSYTTSLRYGVGELAGGTPGQQFFFVFAEVPLYAKNMIWENKGADPLNLLTGGDWDPYGKILDYSGATGSEKLIFVNAQGADQVVVDLGGNQPGKNGGKTTFGSAGLGLIAYRDSVDYLIGNGISTNQLSTARDTTMSFEMQFALDPAKNQQLITLARNGLNFHLSPERGLIPEPSSAMLAALAAMLALGRRRR
jgi:hypothetical protein